jgi:SAM-dependent methyltransferase
VRHRRIRRLAADAAAASWRGPGGRTGVRGGSGASDVSIQGEQPHLRPDLPRLSRAIEAGGIADRRKALLAGLTGQVIEIGAGTGPGFGHYPASVTRVLAVEPERRLRRFATAAARAAPVPVEVTDGLAGALPAGDAGFDAAVVSFMMCTAPDQEAALGEIRRVLRPGGQLCFLEHVRADSAGSPGPSACWMPPSGRTYSPAAISAATLRQRSSGPGSPSPASTGSCSLAPGPRSRFTSLAKPLHAASG